MRRPPRFARFRTVTPRRLQTLPTLLSFSHPILPWVRRQLSTGDRRLVPVQMPHHQVTDLRQGRRPRMSRRRARLAADRFLRRTIRPSRGYLIPGPLPMVHPSNPCRLSRRHQDPGAARSTTDVLTTKPSNLECRTLRQAREAPRLHRRLLPQTSLCLQGRGSSHTRDNRLGSGRDPAAHDHLHWASSQVLMTWLGLGRLERLPSLQ
jgi:hypothetical protein